MGPTIQLLARNEILLEGLQTVIGDSGIDVATATTAIGDTDTLALNSSALGYLFKVPAEGGEFSDLTDGHDTIIATGLGHMGGMSQHPVTEELYVTLPKEGSVISIDPTQRKDYRFEPPVIRGLNMPSCVRFSPSGDEMYVCSFAVGGVWKITGFN